MTLGDFVSLSGMMRAKMWVSLEGRRRKMPVCQMEAIEREGYTFVPPVGMKGPKESKRTARWRREGVEKV